MMKLDIKTALNILSQRRPIFVSESDFQLELGWMLKEMYPNAQILCEYVPEFQFENKTMHIDVLVILNRKWYPIELKYKTKGCKKVYGDTKYILKNHGAKDVNCYLCLKDIERVEAIRGNMPSVFAEGYTIFITNDLTYLKAPQKDNSVYNDFALTNGSTKRGQLKWSESAGAGTTKGNEIPITLQGEYELKWQDYSKIDETSTGQFMCLVNEITN